MLLIKQVLRIRIKPSCHAKAKIVPGPFQGYFVIVLQYATNLTLVFLPTCRKILNPKDGVSLRLDVFLRFRLLD